MNRLFSSLFADRRNSHKPRSSASKSRSARFQVESLEGRQLMTAIPAPAIIAANHNQIITDVYDGYLDRTSNEGLAVSYLNKAADLANEVHDPMGLEDVALGWANMPARSDGSVGWATDNFYVQAISAAQYWLNPTEGAGSGTNYAWGTDQWQQVINSAPSLSNTLKYYGEVDDSYANSIAWLSANNQISLSNMTDQSIPPIAAGTWQVNLGGVEATFNLTQYVGYVAGTVTEDGRTGRFEQVHVADRHADTPSLAAGLWFGGAFTISDWSDGGPTTSGYAEGSTQSSGYMSVFLTNSLGQNVYVGTATRINGDNWTP